MKDKEILPVMLHQHHNELVHLKINVITHIMSRGSVSFEKMKRKRRLLSHLSEMCLIKKSGSKNKKRISDSAFVPNFNAHVMILRIKHNSSPSVSPSTLFTLLFHTSLHLFISSSFYYRAFECRLLRK